MFLGDLEGYAPSWPHYPVLTRTGLTCFWAIWRATLRRGRRQGCASGRDTTGPSGAFIWLRPKAALG